MRRAEGRAGLIGLHWYVGEARFVEAVGRGLERLDLAVAVAPSGNEAARLELTLRGQDFADTALAVTHG